MFPASAITSASLVIDSGIFYASCDQEQNLLSCGLDNKQTLSFDAHRLSIPHNITACQCKDAFKVKCIGWCTSAIQSVEIVSQTKEGHQDVGCPDGKKVLGCHINPNEGDTAEAWREFYPNPGKSKK
jgi:hypothetical protein